MLALCVAAYVLQMLLGDDVVLGAGALYGPDVLAGQWWRLVTAGFLHGGLLHLGVNMFSLVVLGRGVQLAAVHGGGRGQRHVQRGAAAGARGPEERQAAQAREPRGRVEHGPADLGVGQV